VPAEWVAFAIPLTQSSFSQGLCFITILIFITKIMDVYVHCPMIHELMHAAPSLLGEVFQHDIVFNDARLKWLYLISFLTASTTFSAIPAAIVLTMFEWIHFFFLRRK